MTGDWNRYLGLIVPHPNFVIPGAARNRKPLLVFFTNNVTTPISSPVKNTGKGP
jgi:hypothetical protein